MLNADATAFVNSDFDEERFQKIGDDLDEHEHELEAVYFLVVNAILRMD
jgi:hypothetical protein